MHLEVMLHAPHFRSSNQKLQSRLCSFPNGYGACMMARSRSSNGLLTVSLSSGSEESMGVANRLL